MKIMIQIIFSILMSIAHMIPYTNEFKLS